MAVTKSFIHLSDIHFGQERGNGQVYINDDAKQRLIADVRRVVQSLPDQQAHGVIVTGDIAYAGKEEEYEQAGAWLDQVTQAAGCVRTDVHVVPGNHDIDLDTVTALTRIALKQVVEHGQTSLDTFLATERDREMLHGRFKAYQTFAEGYGCPLDSEGKPAGRIYEFTPDHKLFFFGMNSALVCGASEDKRKNEKGTLLLGKRQWPIEKQLGQEVIVLIHHPLDWLQDSDDVGKYIKSRARVLITGHEHNPSLKVEDGTEAPYLTLAAGATVPPHVDGTFTYTYNVIEFSLDEEEADILTIKLHPRTWDDALKDFKSDEHRLGGPNPVVRLKCPNFCKDQPLRLPTAVEEPPASQPPVASCAESSASVPVAASPENASPANDPYPLLRLRFFRDLNSKQRLTVLVTLNALPATLQEPITPAVERRALESLKQAGRLDELQLAIDAEVHTVEVTL